MYRLLISIYIFLLLLLTNADAASIGLYAISPSVNTYCFKFISPAVYAIEMRLQKAESEALNNGLKFRKRAAGVHGSGALILNKDGLGRDMDYWVLVEIENVYKLDEAEKFAQDITDYFRIINNVNILMKDSSLSPCIPDFEKKLALLKNEMIEKLTSLEDPEKINRLSYRNSDIIGCLSDKIRYNGNMFSALRYVDFTFNFIATFSNGEDTYLVEFAPFQGGDSYYDLNIKSLSSVLVGKTSYDYIKNNFPVPLKDKLAEMRIEQAEHLILRGNYRTESGRPVKAVKRFAQAYDMIKPAFSLKEQENIEKQLKAWFDLGISKYAVDIDALLENLKDVKNVLGYDKERVDKTVRYVKLINRELANDYADYRKRYSYVYNIINNLSFSLIPLDPGIAKSLKDFVAENGPSQRELLKMGKLLSRRLEKIKSRPEIMELLKSDIKNFGLDSEKQDD